MMQEPDWKVAQIEKHEKQTIELLEKNLSSAFN